MVPDNKKKIKNSQISNKVEKQIVDHSLKNPKLGATRLSSLLKQTKIDVSPSTVYTILKRHGLQNSKLRQATVDYLRNDAMASKLRKNRQKITKAMETQIVEVSLQNPAYGARRLAKLLATQGIFIAPSALYNLLKRNDLQNSSLRSQKAQERRFAEPPSEAVEFITVADKNSVASNLQLEKVGKDIKKAIYPHHTKADQKIDGKFPDRFNWGFNFLNMMMIAVLGYIVFCAAQNFYQFNINSNAVSVFEKAEVPFEPKMSVPIRPLQEYNLIWERNLFNTRKEESSFQEKSVSLEDIPVARKELGLNLMGTVIGINKKMNYAIIFNKKTRSQEIYREGDQAGEATIKEILRNNIIVTTPRGDERLTINLEEHSIGSLKSPLQEMTKIDSEKPEQKSSITFKVDRENIAPLVADTEGLLQEIRLTQAMTDGKSDGFRVSGIRPSSTFAKLGLRNGDVIREINEESVSGPGQAEYFFRKLAQGGEISIGLFRRRRYQELRLIIE